MESHIEEGNDWGGEIIVKAVPCGVIARLCHPAERLRLFGAGTTLPPEFTMTGCFGLTYEISEEGGISSPGIPHFEKLPAVLSIVEFMPSAPKW